MLVDAGGLPGGRSRRNGSSQGGPACSAACGHLGALDVRVQSLAETRERWRALVCSPFAGQAIARLPAPSGDAHGSADPRGAIQRSGLGTEWLRRRSAGHPCPPCHSTAARIVDRALATSIGLDAGRSPMMAEVGFVPAGQAWVAQSAPAAPSRPPRPETPSPPGGPEALGLRSTVSFFIRLVKDVPGASIIQAGNIRIDGERVQRVEEVREGEILAGRSRPARVTRPAPAPACKRDLLRGRWSANVSQERHPIDAARHRPSHAQGA
jgi:hypothetical protein